MVLSGSVAFCVSHGIVLSMPPCLMQSPMAPGHPAHVLWQSWHGKAAPASRPMLLGQRGGGGRLSTQVPLLLLACHEQHPHLVVTAASGSQIQNCVSLWYSVPRPQRRTRLMPAASA